MRYCFSDSRCQDGLFSCVACDVTFQSASKLEKHNEELHRTNETKKVSLKKSKPDTTGANVYMI